MKTCSKCGESKPFSEFYARKVSPDGLSYHCKPCAKAERKEYYEANRETQLVKLREYQAKNKECLNAKSREYHHKHKDRLRHVYREYYTGFSKALFDATIAKQGNCCAICGVSFESMKQSKIHADHCHDTKTPRGVLCQNCNNGLGQFGDSADGLRKALAYLENPPAQSIVL